MEKLSLYGELRDKIGDITTIRAKRAVNMGIAKISRKGNVYTKFYTLEEFEKEYNKKLKNKKCKAICWRCGKTIDIIDKDKRALCNECASIHKKEVEDLEDKHRRIRSLLFYEKAIELLNRQKKSLDMREYRESALTIKEYLKENYKKFDSSYEIAAAIVLLKDKIRLKIQPSIGNYTGDFILKDERIVLEIDGERHKYKYEYDFERDIEIRNILGNDWEIVRIPTKYLEKNIYNLYEAIMKISSYKAEIRKKNNGLLPEWYSQRERTSFENIMLNNNI